MRITGHVLIFLALIACVYCQQPGPQEPIKNAVITPVPFNKVQLTDEFWKPRLEKQVATLVPFALDKTRPAIEALAQTADFQEGKNTSLPKPHRYQSSDLYKVMEGVAYLLKDKRRPDLEMKMDSIIDIISRAQSDDGYLYVAHITGVSKDHDHFGGGGMGDKPYSFVFHSHELYNMGHMYEGAIAYYQATGKDQWLKVAEKNAQHLNRVFFEGDPKYNNGEPIAWAPGHQELELALTKLFRLTGDSLYLGMAKQFLDIRGVTYKPEGEGVMSPEYAQQHQPVSQQREAVGHAVRATYMYSAMAEVDALTGKEDYQEALASIWQNIVDTKMSITGGLGAVRGIEGFGPEYTLPNKEAYNETCAAVGNVFYNYRMFLNTGDARYLDVLEISLLNNALAGVNLEGNRFFYVNPLESDGVTTFNQGHAGRAPWFNTACCPSNLARLIPQVTGMMYAVDRNNFYVTFYAGGAATINHPEGELKIKQETKYPFDGNIKLSLNMDKSIEMGIRLRIPTWLGNQVVPGELYHYLNDEKVHWTLKINGEVQQNLKIEKGFVVINRQWKNDDLIELYLPMDVKFNKASGKVEADRGKVAISRGPLIYAAEEVDNELPVQDFSINSIPADNQIQSFEILEGTLKNMVGVKFPAQAKGQEKQLTLVPYFAWNNRGVGSMVVWLDENLYETR